MAQILVLDDSEMVCATLCERFKEAGHNALTFGTGISAFEALDSQHFDILLVDVVLKEMSGFDFVEQVRQRPSGISMPIIMMTGSPTPENLTRALRLAVICVLAKPFSFKLLLEKVTNTLSPTRGQQTNFDPVIIRVFLDATLFIFQHLAGIVLEAGKPCIKSAEGTLNDYSAVIGFANPNLKGSMAINVGTDMLIRVLQTLFKGMEGFVVDHEGLKDCCGELANQILGRAKGLFIKERRFNFEISIPTVISGINHLLNYKTNSSVLIIPFKYDSSTVYVEFCLEENQSEQLPPDLESANSVVAEGETLFF